jgi:drug/metabolite transporter (DMT)-like permease
MTIEKAHTKDYLHIHFIVLIWGFTSILGELITLGAEELVFWRVLITSIALWIIVKAKKQDLSLHTKPMLLITASGAIIAIHWILFFQAIKISNISTCLAGVSTCALWTSLIEPMVVKRKFSWVELILGLSVIVGLVIIFYADSSKGTGLFVAILSALFSAIFSVCNALFIRTYQPRVITLYQMIGAVLSIGLWLVITYSLSGRSFAEMMPSTAPSPYLPFTNDGVWLFVLAIGCTVYPYVNAVALMRKFTAFAMNLVINLEPIYGIVLAVIIFGEKEKMSTTFYLGTLVILAAVFSFPLLQLLFSEKKTEPK